MSKNTKKWIGIVVGLVVIAAVVFGVFLKKNPYKKYPSYAYFTSHPSFYLINIESQRVQPVGVMYYLKDEKRKELVEFNDTIDLSKNELIDLLSPLLPDVQEINWIGFSDKLISSGDFYTKEEFINHLEEEANERVRLKRPITKDVLLENSRGSLVSGALFEITYEEFEGVNSTAKDFQEVFEKGHSSVSLTDKCINITFDNLETEEICNPEDGDFGTRTTYHGYSSEMNAHLLFFSIEEAGFYLLNQEDGSKHDFSVNLKVSEDNLVIISYMDIINDMFGYGIPGIEFFDGFNFDTIASFKPQESWGITDVKSDDSHIYFEVTGYSKYSSYDQEKNETISYYFKYSLN